MLIDWRMGPPDGIATLTQLRQLLGSATPPSILVTAFDDSAMWQQAREANFGAVLLKPVTASALHDSLLQVLQGRVAAVAAPPDAPSAGEAALGQHHAGQRVLLVEDNAINQEVAGELLRSASLEVELVADGQQAVALALSRHYDLILMDLQMPVMDGLTAAGSIRRRAETATPIVAMTANAFNEDRAACLDAGMNDHLPKPVDPELLYTKLLRWLPPRKNLAERGAATVDAAGAVPALHDRLAAVEGLDLASALACSGGNCSILTRVLRRFVETYLTGDPALLSADLAPGAPRWHAACHSLRGACSTVGATAVVGPLRAFEQALKNAGDAAELAPAAQALDQSVRALATRIAAALAGRGRPPDARLHWDSRRRWWHRAISSRWRTSLDACAAARPASPWSAAPGR